MKRIAPLISLIAITGCATQPLPPIGIDPIEEITVVDYPEITYPKLSVIQDSQMVTASNNLADAVGVEFVEWAKELNPYDYYAVRNMTIRLTYEDPQIAFLDLFDRSGLLPVYDDFTNTVNVYPYSLDQRIALPHIFTPKFKRSTLQKEKVKRSYKEGLAKNNKAVEYNFYKDYTVRETLSAWAEHSGYNGAIYFFNTRPHREFFASKLVKSDSSIGRNNVDVMKEFIGYEMDRQSLNIPISITKDKATNKIIFHPFDSSEQVRAFEVKTTTVKDNLRRVADQYDYELIYNATDYRIDAGFSTVLTNYIKPSVKAFLSQYPLSIEVVESSKQLVIRGK
ncbi:hypothetical protein [Vibrio sp. Evd11]|uniref:hypothetical protein n=1 Tax=Vibrio sp. Evd11 TaxID=1207404 RepID=UPI000EFB4DF7|nr:hypothetical protein [Vibrio sp. Evd11]